MKEINIVVLVLYNYVTLYPLLQYVCKEMYLNIKIEI